MNDMTRKFPKITDEGLEDLRKRVGVKIERTVEPWCYEAPRDNIRHYAHGIVTATDFESVTTMIDRMQHDLDEQFPEAQVLVRMLEQGPPFAAPVEVRIFGPNLDTLSSLGDTVKRIALMTEDVIHVRESQSGGRPKARLEVDEG